MGQVICPNPDCIFNKNKIPQVYRESGCMKCHTPLPKPQEEVVKQKPPPKPLVAQEWDDAYVSLCVNFKKYRTTEGWKGNAKTAVVDAAKAQGVDNEKDPGFIEAVRGWAQAGAKMKDGLDGLLEMEKLTKSNWDFFKSARCLDSNHINTEHLTKCLTIIKEITNKWNIDYRVGDTQVRPNGIVVGHEELESGKLVTMFSIGHEMGHLVDLTLRDRLYGGYMPNTPCLFQLAISPAFEPAAKGVAEMEHFADLFSAVVLFTSGVSATDIEATTKEMFPAKVSDGDHPKGQLRTFRIHLCLYYRLCVKS